ncbi:MAG: ABC transporter ATP-binding protein [Oscillibacter sp.]|nr:ABC transporter ATP-binding protein [Oscillibacter sp.]
MKYLLTFLKHHKKESILAPLFKMLEALFDLLIPLMMADIINRGIPAADGRYIVGRCLIMILLGLVGLACSITAQYFAAKAAVESCTEIRHGLFDKIQSLGFAQTDTVGVSSLITRMTSDVNQVQNGLNLFLRLLLRSPFIVLGATILAFTINVRGGLLFAAVIPVLAAVIFGIMHKTIPGYEKVQTLLDRLTGITRENLTGVRVVRAFGREADEVKGFHRADAALLERQLRVGRFSALMNPLTYVIINLAIVAILSTGAVSVNIGTMAAGDVVALVNYMGQILLELIKLANLVIQLTKASACAGRIQEVFAMEPQMVFGTARPQPAECEDAVEFSHVSLAYAHAGAESLSDISFTVKKGQTVGVIGGTGSGKTSLVGLIPRYYDATSGEIRLFGRNIRTYDKDALRRSVSTVMQKAQLFSGTIRSNLQWGCPGTDEKTLWQALEIAQAAEIVRGKKKQLDEPVEQGGRNFSGGQKQRLFIARSLVARPDILILDDSSSALDFATDAALRKALKTLPAAMTVFIVSQRASSLRHADVILVLDEGRLVGKGRHDELLRTCGVYRDIYESQFQKEDQVG